MDNGVVKEQQTIFERPDASMMYNLKPLFIREKVDNIRINGVFIEGGAAVNLMPYSLLKKMWKFDTDLWPYNMVLLNYEGKTSYILGAIQVDLTVGTMTGPNLFMVILSKVNYNFLLGKEWIHGIGAIPSILHQKISIWRPDGIVKNIKEDQSYYMDNVSHVDRSNFYRNLAKIPPCYSA